MATLNLSYEDLSAIICLAAHIANADDNTDDSEIQSIIQSITEQYDFRGKEALLRQQIQDGINMDAQAALKLVAALGPVEKQWASNFFVKVAVADGTLEEGERNLYWQIMQTCGLPEHNLQQGGNSGSNDSGDASNKQHEFTLGVFPVIEYFHYDMRVYDGRVAFVQFSSDIRNSIFRYFGNPETLTFFRRSQALDALREKTGWSGDYRLIMIYSKADGAPNKAGSLVAQEPVKGMVLFAIEGPEKKLYGFPTKESVDILLQVLNGMADGNLLVDGEHNPKLSLRYLTVATNIMMALPEE